MLKHNFSKYNFSHNNKKEKKKKNKPSPRILRSKLRVTTVIPASLRERIVATRELARHLFVRRSPSGHEDHVETR